MSDFSARIISEQFKTNMCDFAENAKANVYHYILRPLKTAGKGAALSLLATLPVVLDPQTTSLISTYNISTKSVLIGMGGVAALFGLCGFAFNIYEAATSRGFGRMYESLDGKDSYTKRGIIETTYARANSFHSHRPIEHLIAPIAIMKWYGQTSVFSKCAPTFAQWLREGVPDNDSQYNGRFLYALSLLGKEAPILLSKINPEDLDTYLNQTLARKNRDTTLFDENHIYGSNPVIRYSEFTNAVQTFSELRPKLIANIRPATMLACVKDLTDNACCGGNREGADPAERTASADHLRDTYSVLDRHHVFKESTALIAKTILTDAQERIDLDKITYKQSVIAHVKEIRSRPYQLRQNPAIASQRDRLSGDAKRLKQLKADFAM